MTTTIAQATPDIDIEINQGSDFDLILAWTEDDETTPIPLTGYSARMMIREAYASSTAKLSLTSVLGGGLTIDEDLGEVAIHMTATQTAALPARSCVYDIELVDAEGHVERLAQGRAIVDPEATK